MAKSSAKGTLVHIEANVIWNAVHDRVSGYWMGACPPLNLNAIGDSWEELQEAANEAMQLLLMDLFREGELERFLRINGWRPLNALPTTNSVPRFDVPFVMQQRTRHDELVTA